MIAGFHASSERIEPAQVLGTHLLRTRPARTPDYKAQAEAWAQLAESFATDPQSIADRLANALLRLTSADSSGISLEDEVDGQQIFRWVAAAGALAKYKNGTLPRAISPCSEVVRRDEPLLMVEPARCYPAAAQIDPAVREVLLVPFHCGVRAVGTVWIISHDSSKRFDSEDLRIALVLTRFAGAAADMGRLVRGLRHENDRFLATLSHEMRTPLGTARLAARALQRSSRIGDPSIERQVEIIDRQTTQLLALVDDITDFESIRAGRLRLRFTRVSAQEVVSRALEACGGQIATKKHRVEVAVPQEPVLLTADQVRLTQILINLIGNAVKYTPTGGELKISVEHSKSEVSFRIGDSGIGIDPEFRPHVFDMFVQAPMRNRPRDGGLGLGLALVRDLAELHGGVVTVESAGKGLGAAFTVTLPRAGTQREGPAVTPSRVRSAAKPGSRDQSI